MKPKYRQDTDYFKYHNQNPKNRKTTGDCVVRAISFATDKKWESVLYDLTNIGALNGYMFNDKKVYEKYLNNNNFEKFKQPRKSDNTKYTLKEFAKLYYDNTIVVSIANHLTVVEKGIIYDTWNCGNKCVGNYYVKI